MLLDIPGNHVEILASDPDECEVIIGDGVAIGPLGGSRSTTHVNAAGPSRAAGPIVAQCDGLDEVVRQPHMEIR